MQMLLIAIALLVVSYIIQAFVVKQPKVKPVALEDIDFPTADDGEEQRIIFGDAWTDGPMVLYYGNMRTIKIKSGGKK